MAELTVTRYSHHFSVTRMTPRGRTAVSQFARRYIEYTLKKRRGRPGFDEVPDCTFATATADRFEYRFHINQMQDFQDHVRAFDLGMDGLVEYIDVPLKEPRKVELRVQPQWKPREKYKQPEAIEFLTDTRLRRKLLGMPTGYGKSYSTMQAIANLSLLSFWCLRGGFVEKTRLDLLKTYDIQNEDIWVINGTKDLKLMLLMAMSGPLDCKVILMGNKLMQIWMSLYQKLREGTLDVGYSCLPHEFYEHIGVGVRVIDEVHLDFHMNFLQDLHSHVWMSFSLSATMLTDNPFRNRMYQLAYPLNERFEVDYVPYISATSITYEFEKPERIKVMGKQGTYSHHVFEESLMKDKKVLAGYVNMIKLVVQKELLQDRVPGERMAIYAAGVEFCSYLVDELSKMFPELNIVRYCGSANDPYDDLLTCDLAVTTLGSAGTNVDIPNLKCVLLTTAVDSSQSNVQGFGRLRDALAEGRVPRFVWFTCPQIGRQVIYHQNKVELLRSRAKTLNTQYYGVPL